MHMHGQTDTQTGVSMAVLNVCMTLNHILKKILQASLTVSEGRHFILLEDRKTLQVNFKTVEFLPTDGNPL